MSPITGLIWPFSIKGGRFWRTLATCSPGTGTVESHTPTLPVPSVSMTKLANPSTRGVRICPPTSTPPADTLASNPPLKTARRSGSSAVLTDDEDWGPSTAAPAGGSRLPMCRLNCTCPARYRTTVMRRPSGSATSRSSMMTPLGPTLIGVQPGSAGTVVVGVDGSVVDLLAEIDLPVGAFAAEQAASVSSAQAEVIRAALPLGRITPAAVSRAAGAGHVERGRPSVAWTAPR